VVRLVIQLLLCWRVASTSGFGASDSGFGGNSNLFSEFVFPNDDNSSPDLLQAADVQHLQSVDGQLLHTTTDDHLFQSGDFQVLQCTDGQVILSDEFLTNTDNHTVHPSDNYFLQPTDNYVLQPTDKHLLQQNSNSLLQATDTHLLGTASAESLSNVSVEKLDIFDEFTGNMTEINPDEEIYGYIMGNETEPAKDNSQNMPAIIDELPNMSMDLEPMDSNLPPMFDEQVLLSPMEFQNNGKPIHRKRQINKHKKGPKPLPKEHFKDETKWKNVERCRIYRSNKKSSKVVEKSEVDQLQEENEDLNRREEQLREKVTKMKEMYINLISTGHVKFT